MVHVHELGPFMQLSVWACWGNSSMVVSDRTLHKASQMSVLLLVVEGPFWNMNEFLPLCLSRWLGGNSTGDSVSHIFNISRANNRAYHVSLVS